MFPTMVLRACCNTALAVQVFAAGVLGLATVGRAGLSASQVVVIVNADSLRSRSVANHYVHWRNIPSANVIVLQGVPNSETISVDVFRDKILKPLLSEIERRQLAGSVQCIAYSADFPTAIDISKDLEAVKDLPPALTRVGSINALTYFYRWVQNSDPSYVGLGANFYARRPLEAFFQNPGSGGMRDSWDAIDKQMRDKDHDAAAKALEKLLVTMPNQHPIAYLAAGQYALAGDKVNALRLLGMAISKGWTNGQYLKDDSQFASIRDESQFQSLELSLEQTEGSYQPAVGFDARTFWSPNGVSKATPSNGMSYLLSVVLAVTRGEGTTLQEAIAALERSSSADFTQPDGGFYFCSTSDVRTTTRQPGFDEAIRQLKRLNFQAEVVNEALPTEKPQVLGACIGAAAFDWAGSKSVLVPGSIAENLTSLGATMSKSDGQTKLTELIKAGAAGSSGTVTEPYAIQAKFPHPMMYVHYAQGASLAEAFYLNVNGPYQLLIVGDPLCQPFANPRRLELDTSLQTVTPGQSLALQLGKGTGEENKPSHASWKAALDPVLIGVGLDSAAPQYGIFRDRLQVNLTGKEQPGYHELRLAVVSSGDLAIRREIVLPRWIGQEGSIKLEAPTTAALSSDQKIFVKVSAPGAKQVSVWHDSEQLGVASLQVSDFALSADMLGLGPVRLQGVAKIGDATIRSEFHVLTIEP